MPDGKFSMMRKGMPFEGHCQYSGNTIRLIPETSVGRPPLDPISFEATLTFSDAGDLTVTDVEGLSKVTLPLSKVQPWE